MYSILWASCLRTHSIYCLHTCYGTFNHRIAEQGRFLLIVPWPTQFKGKSKISKIIWNLLNTCPSICQEGQIYLSVLFKVKHFIFQIFLVKLRHYEKAVKFEKNIPPVLTKQLFFHRSVKTSGRFFQFFVAASEKLDFTFHGKKWLTGKSQR